MGVVASLNVINLLIVYYYFGIYVKQVIVKYYHRSMNYYFPDEEAETDPIIEL